MCEPITLSTLGWVSLGLSTAGTAYAAYSAREEGRAQQDVAEENARRAGIAATDEERRGKIEGAAQRMRVRQIFGRQKAEQASSGLEVGTGSSFDVLADTLQVGESDALAIENESARRAWGLRLQGQDYITSGRLARMSARGSQRGTLLTGAGQFANQAWPTQAAGGYVR